MAIDKKVARKRPYSAPNLTVYGDMATLTKGGLGSVPESASMTSMQQLP